jgi:hypothetical protein
MKPKTMKAPEDSQAEIRAKADAARAKATPKGGVIHPHKMTMQRGDWLLNEIAPGRRSPGNVKK